jgi:hypothetical protein
MTTDKRKNFKWKSKYYEYLILRFLIIIAFSWLFINLLIYSGKEIVEMFGNRELYGRAKKRGAIVLGRFLATKWGKPGIVIPSFLMLLGAIYYFLKEYFEFRRFLKKDKLYRQGLVDNLFDDNKPRSIFQIIKWVFSKKERSIRHNLSTNYKII